MLRMPFLEIKFRDWIWDAPVLRQITSLVVEDELKWGEIKNKFRIDQDGITDYNAIYIQWG